MARKSVFYHLVSVLSKDWRSPLALCYNVQRMICDSLAFCLEYVYEAHSKRSKEINGACTHMKEKETEREKYMSSNHVFRAPPKKSSIVNWSSQYGRSWGEQGVSSGKEASK